MKKANAVIKKIWSIGEKKIGRYFAIRTMLHDSVVRGIILYGMEVCNWERQAELEKLQISEVNIRVS